jgi:hypothetical protein
MILTTVVILMIEASLGVGEEAFSLFILKNVKTQEKLKE